MSLYLRNIVNLIPESDEFVKDFVIDNGGISVFLRIYKVILSLEGKKPNSKTIEKYTGPAVNFLRDQGVATIKKYKKRCANEAGKDGVAQEILKALVDVNEEVSSFLKDKMELVDKLAEFEVLLRKVVETEFRKRSWKWVKRNIDGELIKQVNSRIKSKNKDRDKIGDFCRELTLGQSSEIIIKYQWGKIFRSVFVRTDSSHNPNDQRYANEELFLAHWKLAKETRNKLSHKRKQNTVTRKDKEDTNNFLDRTMSIIETTYNFSG